MSVLVDTSVLSLVLLRRKTPAPPHRAAERLREMLLGGERVALTGVVLQEILSGPRTAAAAAEVADHLRGFPLLEPERATYESAAALHRGARGRGIAATTIDCLIAATAVHHDVALLTTDEDFVRLAPLCGLRLA